MTHHAVRGALSLVLAPALLLASSSIARAETLQAPVGGKPVPLGDGRIGCGSPPGWSLEPDGRAVRPPASDGAVGQSAELRVAPDLAACAASKSTVTLVATAAWPAIDPAGTLLAVDEARLEIRGKRLRGVRVVVRSAARTVEDVCLDPKPDGTAERCTLAAGRGLPADPFALALAWAPAGGRAGADVTTFDADGRRAAPSDLALQPAKITITSIVPGGAAVDFAAGARKVALTHPEAVASVSCSPAECELADGGVAVRGLGATSGPLSLRFKLLPRVLLTKGDSADPAPSLTVPVLACPLEVLSGPPLRDLDDTRVVVRVGGSCARDAQLQRLRYRIRGAPAETLRVVAEADAADVVLRAVRIAGSDTLVEALRPEPDVSVVGAVRIATRPAPTPHASLELEGHGTVDFIPTNREVVLHLAGDAGGPRLALLPVEGVYTTASAGGVTRLRGVPTAAGFVALRFAYRAEGLPAALGEVDLGFAADPVERSIHTANLQAPLVVKDADAKPLVEMLCETEKGHLVTVSPGVAAHVPYGARDGCRLVFHRSRLAPEYGAQKLMLDVDVTRVDGTSRAEGKVTQSIVLRPGGEDRTAWIKGVAAPFDRVSVRLSHAADESHYADGEESLATPAEQWAVIMGASRARLYATTAIPTGMYRVADRDHSGILTLNFGVLGRLTWLDAEGQEGVLGLETGIMGVGLANDQSASGHSLTQVAAVLGAGLGVPIANRGAPTETSINLHAWAELEPARFFGGGSGSPVGFVFGPSISIGNIGTNL